MNFDYIYKYIIIGDSNVGKSCLVLRFIEGEFNSDQENTVGVEFGAKVIESKGQNIKIQIWDTAGQEAFQSITRSYYRSAAGALLVFDLTNEESFENVEKWLDETRNNGNGDMVVCLVGNKCDMEGQRKISTEKAEEFAKSNGMFYVETSALKDLNVEESFRKVTRAIMLKVEKGEIDVASNESGVRKTGGELVTFEEFDELMKKSRKKRRCKC